MTRDEAISFVEYVEARFGRFYPANSKKMIADEILNDSSAAAKKALTQLEAEEKFLPSPAMLVKIVREWSAEFREREALQRRKEQRSTKTVFDQPQDTEHAHLACKLARATLAGLSREKVIEGMMHLQKMRPNAGWATAASRLQRLYDLNKQKEI